MLCNVFVVSLDIISFIRYVSGNIEKEKKNDPAKTSTVFLGWHPMHPFGFEGNV